VIVTRFLRWLFAVVVVEAIVLLLLAWIIPGFRFEDPSSLIPMALLIPLWIILLPIFAAVAGFFLRG
jgi:hypothetical protein